MQKRRAKRETATILKELMTIDVLFNRAILSETTEKAEEVSYDQLYTIFLDAWEVKLANLQRKDLRIVVPNRRYFADSYAPKIAKQ